MAFITGKGYDGKTWTLRDGAGQGVNQGTTVVSFRKERHIIDGGSPPHKPDSEGKVYTDRHNSPNRGGNLIFYPSVFGLRWVRDEVAAS